MYTYGTGLEPREWVGPCPSLPEYVMTVVVAWVLSASVCAVGASVCVAGLFRYSVSQEVSRPAMCCTMQQLECAL